MKIPRPTGKAPRPPFPFELDADWQARIGEKNQLMLNQQPRLTELIDRLVAVDGCVVCLRPEPDLDVILQRGCTWGGKAQSMPGQPSQCHSNSALCWEANREHSRIATGYALSDDGMWRQHTWVVCPSGRRTLDTADPSQPSHWKLVETTAARLAYFGVVMTEKESERFLDSNT